MMAMRLTERKL